MKTEKSLPNGTHRLDGERSISDEFQNSVLPQVVGLFSDVEAVVHSQVKLAEAKVFDRIQRLEQKLVFGTLGAGFLIIAMVLFVVTIVYEVADIFPSVPLWGVTGVMSVITCLLGGFLLTSAATPLTSRVGQ